MNNIKRVLSDTVESLDRAINSAKRSMEAIENYLTPVADCGDCPKLKLEDCSWAEIAEYAKSGQAASVFSIGDTKTITLKNRTNLHVRIIGFNHDVDEAGSSLPITFDTVETLNDDYQMNGHWTNAGGWKASVMRKKLNMNIWKLLPDELQSVIKPCVKTTSEGERSENLCKTTDCLFLLSEQEMFGRKIWSAGGEGKWYEWYSRENTSYEKHMQNGNYDWWWLRSPVAGSSTSFCLVSYGGSASNSFANVAYGVSFGFCV